VFLENFVAFDDFTGGLVNLLVEGNKVPESRFGSDGIGGENLHLVDLRIWVHGRWEFSADDLVFFEIAFDLHFGIFCWSFLILSDENICKFDLRHLFDFCL